MLLRLSVSFTFHRRPYPRLSPDTQPPTSPTALVQTHWNSLPASPIVNTPAMLQLPPLNLETRLLFPIQ